MVLSRPARIRAARTSISKVILFSRGNAATLTGYREDLTLPTAKGGSQREKRPSMLLRSYTLLTALLVVLLPRRTLSCVG
jgi:hypothetical protein